MLPTIDPSAQQFLNAVNRVQTRLETAQNQLASGLRVSRPSDAPDQVAPILELEAAIQRNLDIQGGVKSLKTEVDTGEQTLASCVNLMDQAATLASQATGPLQTAATRASLAQQAAAILEQMVTASRTTTGGRYIFSGDTDQAPQYELNLTDPAGVTQLHAAPSTRLAQGPGGSTFPAAHSAAQIFDDVDGLGQPTSKNVFAALNGLRLALANNDEDALRDSIAAVSSASTHLNSELAFYGLTQTRIAGALEQTGRNDLQLRAELSAKQDADATEAILEVTQAQLQLEATYQARAKVSQKSLFELL